MKKILHVIKENTKFKYRRYRFDEWLKKHTDYEILTKTYNIEDCKLKKIESSDILTNITLSDFQYIIFSSPDIFNLVGRNIPSSCIVFYNKEDFWNGYDKYLSKDVDYPLVTRADKIVCSSKFIYDRLPKDKTLLVENGADISYFPVAKTKTGRKKVIYISTSSVKKIDGNILRRDAIENPDMDFYIYVNFYNRRGIKLNRYITEFSLPNNVYFPEIVSYNEILEKVSECDIGYLPMANTDWAAGMFTLKFWDYMKCNIPTYYYNSDNYYNYDDKFAFNAKKYKLKDMLSVKLDRDETKALCYKNQWEFKFQEIADYYGFKWHE